MAVPKYDELFNPALQALHSLGGSSSIAEMEEEVIKILNLSETDVADLHKGNTTKLSYRLAWARTYLKRFGLLENSSRGIWSLTQRGLTTESVDKKQVKDIVQNSNYQVNIAGSEFEEENEDVSEEYEWKDRLLEIVKHISPDSFERLCMRLLRESGFTHVTVTGKSGDGGIDGKGVVKLGGLLSFHVVFQCKRYKDSVGSGVVRDFRGAMQGRADKGLIISTGTFTRDARQEAQRDGASPIDLIDGEMLTEKLKELKLGVRVEEKIIEDIIIKEDWFSNL
ncbi:restriction system protein [Paenibacillus sp. RC73]|uniref:restriction endonuclease n=1 Tax=Paenibacillus TaxID=44249 RepID=UPI0020249498|nr:MULTISPECIES: restriction endonuclease [Paenibacillus]URJ44466.1 restriction endonuclease [Paenibacillus polymyxa]